MNFEPTHTPACEYVSVHVYLYDCVYVCVYICAYACTHMCYCIYVYVCAFVYISICVCMNTCALISDSNVKVQDNLEKNMFMSPDVRDALMLP